MIIDSIKDRLCTIIDFVSVREYNMKNKIIYTIEIYIGFILGIQGIKRRDARVVSGADAPGFFI